MSGSTEMKKDNKNMFFDPFGMVGGESKSESNLIGEWNSSNATPNVFNTSANKNDLQQGSKPTELFAELGM